jgi:hypothetical protein
MPTAAPDRPTIPVTNTQFHEQTDAAWDSIVAANDDAAPEVLVRGSELVRISSDDGGPTLKPWVAPALRERMSRVGFWAKVATDGEGQLIFTPTKPPLDVAQALLAREPHEYEGAPQVNRIVDVPVFGADGSLLTTPGYHAASRTFYLPAPDFGPLPEIATDMDSVILARDFLLGELLRDFPFVDAADRANALGLLLLPFARELIDGPTPMHAIMAHTPGTGKSLLARALLLAGCGEVAPAPEPGSAEEWRKVITSQLIRGTSAIVFDNLRQKLDSGPLAAALTTAQWEDRILGENRMVSAPVRNAWVATVNNLALTTEQARRIAPIYLDAGVEAPWDHEPAGGYRHPDLIGWARVNRARLVWAALTLIQNWLDGAEYIGADENGDLDYLRSSERVSAPRMLASFESWSNVIGGILAAAGINDHLGNRDKLHETADEEQHELATFLASWADKITEPIETAQLKQYVQYGGPLYDDLPTELRGLRVETLEKQLPVYLRSNRRKPAGGLRLDYITGKRRKWIVEHIDN